MAGHARKNFVHMGNPFVHGGIQCCPHEVNGFGGGAVWLWRLRVSVLPPEGFRIGAGELAGLVGRGNRCVAAKAKRSAEAAPNQTRSVVSSTPPCDAARYKAIG